MVTIAIFFLPGPEICPLRYPRELGELVRPSQNMQPLPFTSCLSGSPGRSDIQGFMIEKDGVSKLVYIDLADLGDHRKLSFGDGAVATPFTEVQINSLKVKELEKKLNLN